jgi:hypothetical protein
MIGAAYSIILSYLAMVIACYFIGKRYFPVPYKFSPLMLYSVILVGIAGLSFYVSFDNNIIDITFNILVPIIIAGIVYIIEKKNLIKPIHK